MDNTSQRAYVKIRFQLNDKPRISPFSYQPLRGVCVTLQTIQIWCKSTREGTFTPVKTPTPGRPWMTSSEANVRRVKNILEVNPRRSAWEILNNLFLPRSTVHRILKAHLNFRSVYSVWVPHVLSDFNKRQQIQCWEDILKLLRTNSRSFLVSHYLVQDESWTPWDFEDNQRVCEADDTPPGADTSEDNGYRSLYQSTKVTFTNSSTPRSYSEL